MAESKRRRNTPASGTGYYGNVAYNLDYYGDVVAAPAPEYAPPRPQARPQAPAAPAVKPRVHERSRVRVQVRQQQAVAPFAICGFLAAVAIAVVLLLGYAQLNSVYADTVSLRQELTTLQTESSKLEARFAEAFDRETLEAAVAADGTLVKPSSSQAVYIDLSEPDSAVVYDNASQNGGLRGFLRSVGELVGSAVEFFR